MSIIPIHDTDGVLFNSLPSQGNIYALSPLTDAQGYTKLLVASLQRKASSIISKKDLGS